MLLATWCSIAYVIRPIYRKATILNNFVDYRLTLHAYWKRKFICEKVPYCASLDHARYHKLPILTRTQAQYHHIPCPYSLTSKMSSWKEYFYIEIRIFWLQTFSFNHTQKKNTYLHSFIIISIALFHCFFFSSRSVGDASNTTLGRTYNIWKI